MRVVHRRWLRGLVLLSLLALLVPLAGGSVAAQTVGSSTIDGGAEWQYSVEASSPNGGILIHRSLGETYFMYLEEDLSALPAADNDTLLDTVTLPRFREAFGIADMPLTAQGSLVTSAWRLYDMASADGSFLVLFVVDVTEVPGAGAVEILIAPKTTFADGLASAGANITINGYAALIASVPSTAILNAAGLPSSPASTMQPTQAPTPAPASVPTPTPVMASAPTQAPATGAQTVTTGTDTVTYGGEWELDSANSTAESAIFRYVLDPDVGFGYLQSPDRESGGDVQAAMRIIDPPRLGGATNAQELAFEILPSGRAYALYAWEREGVNEVALFLVDVTTTPGTIRMQFLLTTPTQFLPSMTSVQQAIQINGEGALRELDSAALASLIGGSGAPAQQAPASQTPVAGQATDYRAQDAPAGCDGIGWVMTDPSQLPVSQADLDARSSCVGGATYAASCGTYLDTGTGVHCTVNVGVGTSPMAVTSQQFTLVDAAGSRYPVDLEVTYSHIMVLGGPELPETTVDAGATTRGTLIFNPPSNAPMPWVIEIAPDTIATSGERPGVLVIEGPLQPYSGFGQ